MGKEERSGNFVRLSVGSFSYWYYCSSPLRKETGMACAGHHLHQLCKLLESTTEVKRIRR